MLCEGRARPTHLEVLEVACVKLVADRGLVRGPGAVQPLPVHAIKEWVRLRSPVALTKPARPPIQKPPGQTDDKRLETQGAAARPSCSTGRTTSTPQR